MADPSRDGLRILIVDDLVSMRGTIRNMLRQLGHTLTAEADNGLHAWQKLESGTFDLAIVDWNMPVMNGMELLRRARADKRFADTPFIMVTAEVAESTIAEAAETEVDAYIVKPFVPKTLAEKIRQVMDRKRHPSTTDLCLRKVQIMMEHGHFSRAQAEIHRALKGDPVNPRLMCALGDLYVTRGLVAEAEKAYKNALRYEPRFVQARDRLGAMYAASGQPAKVIAVLKEAAQISPQNARRQTALGRALMESGQIEEARRSFDVAAKTEPENVQLQMDIAEVFMAHDLPEKAAERFAAVLEITPRDVHVYNRLGISYRQQGKYDEAAAQYRKAIRIAPEDGNLFYNLGRVYLEAGKKTDAAQQFRHALALDPGFAEAEKVLKELGESTGTPGIPEG